MNSLHQVVASVAPADAVSEQVFAWRRVFRRWGLESEIVVGAAHKDLQRFVHRLDSKGGREILEDGVVLLRYSIWGPTVEAALGAAGPRVLWYHNVTPGDLLRPFNPGVAALCDQARRALPQFGGRFAALVADSSFNAADLRASGLGESAVVPLLLDLGKRDDPPRAATDNPVILSVGRIAPNKRLEDVIKVFALYQRHREPSASLVLVGGDDDFEDYRRAIERLTERLGVARVRFTGRIPAPERDGWYAKAAAYLCMSVHEGFCAPLIEALSYGVPVVARKAGAVPETLGGAGLVLDSDDLPLFAEAVHDVVSSPATRAGLAAAVARRLGELRPEIIEESGRAALRPVLSS